MEDRTRPRTEQSNQNRNRNRKRALARKRRQRNLVIKVFIFLVVIVGVIGGAFLIKKYGPTKEKADLNEYYGIQKENQLAVIIDNEVLGAQGIMLDGKVYIENPRKYLMNTLNVSINTVTKIHKELNRVRLIKDVWDDVGKPNIVYINYCETPKPQVIHKTYEAVKVEEKKKEIKPVEVKKEQIIVTEIKEELVEKITDKDLEDAQKVLKEYKVGKIDLEASKILKSIKLYLYKAKEEELIKIAIRILVKKKREEDRLELLKKITTYEVSYALERCKDSVRNEELIINKLTKYIETKIEDANYWN